MGLSGKVAFVTGGSSGIGEAAAKLLVREGVRVAIVGTKHIEVEKAAGEMRGPGEAMPLVVDVSNADEVKAGIDRAVARWGRLDYVFANAGINGTWAPIDELEPEEWDKVQAVNLRGTFLTVKYAVPHLRRQGGGSIVVTSSVNGTRMFSNVGASAYATTKAGQVAFAKMMALELGQDRIRVNVICPGAIETPINSKTDRSALEGMEPLAEYPQGEIPLTEGEPGTAAQVGELVKFLFSDASNHISGTEIWIDGAQSLLQG